MTEPSLLETLRRSRFLEGVGPEELSQLATVARLADYRPGALIFREGEPLAHIFVVAEGSVSLEICLPGQGCKRIQTIGPGELLGWSPILDQTPMTATARALAPTRLIALNASQVLALCSHKPTFGFVLMRQTARALAARLNATRLQLLDVYRNELPAVAGTPEGAGP
jgi:CRP/FNR family cyclic AMP-dependent transcriptional regulator